jgi:hypothetical protein
MFIGVWSQPRGSLAKWRDRGINVLFGWEPERNSQGVPSVSQADWRAAARALGLAYYDRPSDDVQADGRDPYLVGFIMDDEPDRRVLLPAINALKTEKDPARRAALQKTIDDYVASYKAIADRCRATGKPVFGNFSGPDVTGGFPWYAGQGQKPILPLVTEIGADWYPVNSDPNRYPATLVGQQLDLLVKWNREVGEMTKPLWCFVECGYMRKGSGRAPTAAEVDAEVDQALARNVKGIIWFPQGFSPFTYDSLDATQAQKVAEVSKRLATPWTPPPIDPTPRAISRVVVQFSDGTSTTIDPSTGSPPRAV